MMYNGFMAIEITEEREVVLEETKIDNTIIEEIKTRSL